LTSCIFEEIVAFSEKPPL